MALILQLQAELDTNPEKQPSLDVDAEHDMIKANASYMSIEVFLSPCQRPKELPISLLLVSYFTAPNDIMALSWWLLSVSSYSSSQS